MTRTGSHHGRSYVVTGAASGIGRALSLQLLGEGANVSALDRDAAGLERLAAGHARGGGAVGSRGGGGAVAPAVVDVTDEGQVATAVAEAAERWGGLAGVATCAGVFVGGDFVKVADLDLDVFRAVLDVNLLGTVSAIKHALPHLSRPGGAVVTVASTAALLGHGVGSGYTASKGGVAALTRLLAVQYGPEGIRANCVCPGATVTPMTGDSFTSPAGVEAMRRAAPLQRAGQADEPAAVIAFLLSEAASFMTGATVPVDGGVTIA